MHFINPGNRSNGRRPRHRWLAAFGASFVACLLTVSVAAQEQPAAAEPDPQFTAWLQEFRQDALKRGISEATLDTALAGVKPIARVIELDRRQPEFTQTFWRYVDARVTKRRIDRGKMLLKTHAKLLDRIWREYGVQPRFLVAFWGLESNFGDHFGGFPVVQALATLAYDPRRGRFFRAQLFDALTILDRGDIGVDQMRGSWAGAMGHLQFIPSTFTRYAVDADGDGRRDIWNSLPDVFASAANYLSKIGWRGDETWGREVKLPNGFDFELTSKGVRKPLTEWQRLGVRRVDGRNLPVSSIEGSIILPAGHRGPAFVVYHNFQRILNWNRSVLYAIAVGHLADRYAGKGALQGPRPAAETPLSRDMIREMQRLLAAQGHLEDDPDGVVGPLTRAGIRSFQRSRQMPPDGFPTVELLQILRGN